MLSFLFSFPLCAVAALPATPLPAQKGRIESGFTPLLQEGSLKGWRGRPHLDPRVEAAMKEEERAAKQLEWNADRDAHWRVEGKEIVNDGHGVFLTTEKEYGDFDLRLEYKTVPLADSGIYLRANPQVQIWDWREEGGKWELGADKGSGGLWNNQVHERFPTKLMDRPFGKWNELRIVMVGSKVSVWMNGEKVVHHTTMENYFDRARPVPMKGPIQLQTHGGEIRWRNLRVKEFSAQESNDWLAVHDKRGFRSIFNGNSFKGWAGATDEYQIEDGAILCKPGSGGNLYTKREWSDFQARFEFQLPPGGNNGLAIRYPGEGTPAYQGMCELQVLDNTAEKYANLKEYQFHGSAYGMFPAHRGFLREVGAWNFEQVTVQGSRIQVELNGFLILDCDLSELPESVDAKKHPGKDRTTGFFGFAGHGDPVRFRAIQMRDLSR
ncbi:MAG: DUF1080 domain-containing protein [Planctomycetes bacterium]|nr:DUF1080 domain-containing protein [Planctomycetota bacterium]